MVLFAPTKRLCIVKRDMQNRRNFLGWHRPRHLFGTEEPRKVYFNNTCVERARRRFFDGLYYFSFSSFSLKCLKKRDNRYLPLSVSSLIREILKKKKDRLDEYSKNRDNTTRTCFETIFDNYVTLTSYSTGHHRLYCKSIVTIKIIRCFDFSAK